MVFGSSTLHEAAKGENWPLGADFVPVTDAYKYLGIWVTPTLSLAAVVAKNAEKGARVCAMLNPILRNKVVPIYTKSLILKAMILPILTYVWGGAVRSRSKSTEIGDSSCRAVC